MSYKSLFSVGVRILGLVAIGHGILDLLYVALYLAGVYLDLSVIAKFPGADLVLGCFYFFSGVYLLRGAPMVIDFAYPEDKSEITSAADEDVQAP